MNVSRIELGIKSALVAGAVTAATILVPAAQADIYINTTGGTSCKGSSGFGAQNLYFSNTSVQNTREIGQYVTCEIPYLHGGSPTSPLSIQINGHNPTGATVHFTCALQAGQEGFTLNTAIYEFDLPATSIDTVVYAHASSVPVIPAPPSSYAPYSISCLLAPSAKIGLIHTTINANL